MNRLMRSLYRGVLWLYPASFRRRYGPMMLDDARALWLADRRAGRPRWRTVVRMARDVAYSVPREWTRTLTPGFAAVWSDLDQAARGLRRQPMFSGGVVTLMAVGIGAGTLAFSVVSAYVLRPLPYPEADRLVQVMPAPGVPVSEVGDLFEIPLTWDLDAFTLLDEHGPEMVYGAWVGAGYLEAFGLQAALGRTFTGEDGRGSGPAAALISHALWQRRYGGDPGVLGQTLSVFTSDRPDDAELFTIVGVLAEGAWHHHRFTDFLTPLHEDQSVYAGRLRRGVSPAEAARVLGARAAARGERPDPDEPLAVVSIQARYSQALLPLFRVGVAVVLLALLITCGNAAALLLVRAAKRQGEFGVRRALGAGRSRLVRQLLAEGLLLAGTAAALGVALAAVGLDVLAEGLQSQIGRQVPGGPDALRVDVRALVGTLGLTAATGLLFGLVPLVRLHERGGATSGLRGRTAGPARQRMLAVLVAGGVALSLSLVVPAASALRSVGHFAGLDLGFDPERAVTGSVLLRAGSYPEAADRSAFYARLTAALADLPGVAVAGVGSRGPFGAEPDPVPVEAEPSGGGARGPVPAVVLAVDGGWMDALGLSVTSGRIFQAGDGPGTEPVAVLSRSLADGLWPGADPVGRRVRLARDGGMMQGGEPGSWRTVVGVVDNIRTWAGDDDRAQVYLPFMQAPSMFASVVVRARGPLEPDLEAGLRGALRDVDPSVALSDVRRVDEGVSAAGRPARFLASFLGAVSAFAIAVAVLGLYAVLSFVAAERRRDLAIRMALGAQGGQVARRFLAEGLLLVGAGLVVGLLGAAALDGRIVTQLVGVRAGDPFTYLGSALLLLTVGALAAWVPARRAAGADPMRVLRQD